MAKLEGYKKIAVVTFGKNYPYYFAIFDDGNEYKAGDFVVFSGNSTPARIDEIITKEEADARSSKSIIAEVIGKVDISAYEKRLEKRKEKEKLKKEMKKRKKEIQERIDDEYYASVDESYAALLKQYKSL